jgi:hypothetical protein
MSKTQEQRDGNSGSQIGSGDDKVKQETGGTPVKGEAGDTAEASNSDGSAKKILVDLRSEHVSITTHAAKALAERWAEEGKSWPDDCAFSQAVFGCRERPELNVARQVSEGLRGEVRGRCMCRRVFEKDERRYSSARTNTDSFGS